jgi:hypothetical protein
MRFSKSKKGKTKMMTKSVTYVLERGFQMKGLLLVVLAAILLTACGAKSSEKSSANSGTNDPPPPAKPAVGDPVVAKSGSSWFTEGKIRVIEGQKANIAWSQKDRTPTDVDLANVYLIPKPGARPDVKADDYVLAKTTTSSDYTDWTITQVTNVSKDVITVKDRSNSTYNLGPDKVIAVAPTDAADIKAEFDKNNKQLDFDKKAQAGRPAAPDGYKPKVSETVVASSASNTWFTGQVKSMTGDRATIVWDTKENSTFDTTLDKIVPNPTAAGTTMPAVNDYVLIKSPSCVNCSLIYTQAVAVNGTNVEVKDRYDSTYTVRPGDFLLLK